MESVGHSGTEKPTKELKDAERVLYTGTELGAFKVILGLSVLSLGALFFPFAKTGLLAVIFAFAFVGTKDHLRTFSQKKKIAFFVSVTLVVTTFVGVFASIFRILFSAMSAAADPSAIPKLKHYLEGLFSPTLEILKERLLLVLYQLDTKKAIEVRLTDSANRLFDFIVNFAFGWITEIPENLLQFSFFLFFLIFFIRRIGSVELFESLLFGSKNRKTLGFLISTAKMGGYSAIVTTVITALVQASVLTLGSLVGGIPYWPTVFVTAFISSMIPIVGILPVAIVCTVYAGSQMNLQSAGTVGAFGLGASLIDNLLRPLLAVGESNSLNPVLCFFGLIGALYLFGFAGLFIGPFVLAFTSAVFAKYNVHKMVGFNIDEK
jgi:predicted PurR-regulated permease PerM